MAKNSTIKYKRGSAVRPPKQAEVKYRKMLLKLVAEINEQIKAQVLPVIRQNKDATISDSVKVQDGYISDVSEAFAVIQMLLNLESPDFAMGSAAFVGMVGKEAEQRANKAIQKAGFDIGTLKSIADDEKIGNALDALTAENTDLITSLGNDYLRKIQKAVTDNYLTGKYTGDGGLEKELSRISGVTKNRAKLIARDQTSKISSSMVQIRSQNSGSIGYRWHNVGDSRVRGNPNGKYPDVPQTRNHWDRENKYYLWKHMANPPKAPDGKPFRQPPVDGSPGQAINCRCYSSPVWVEQGGEFVGG